MKKRTVVPLLLIAVVLIWRTVLAPVDETEYVIVTRFGQVIGHPLYEPGLHFKLPWHSVIRLDKRLQTLDPKPSECLLGSTETAQEKGGVGTNVVVAYFVNWRILGLHSPEAAKGLSGDERNERLDGPKNFFKAVNGNFVEAQRKLLDIIPSKISATLGRHDMSSLVSTDPKAIKVEEIEKSVTEACRSIARSNLYIEIEDVRIKRIALPEQNKQSVFERMRTERQRKARKFRAEGQRDAISIRAQADKEARKLLAEARREAELIKGKGDAEATAIYAKAHNKDPEFYRLVRTLAAYKKFLNENTTVVLSADSELLQLLTKSHWLKGKVPPSGATGSGKSEPTKKE